MDSRFRGNDGRGVACGCVWAEERKARSERRGAKGEERKARSERRGAKGEERKARSERRGAKGEGREASEERSVIFDADSLVPRLWSLGPDFGQSLPGGGGLLCVHSRNS